MRPTQALLRNLGTILIRGAASAGALLLLATTNRIGPEATETAVLFLAWQRPTALGLSLGGQVLGPVRIAEGRDQTVIQVAATGLLLGAGVSVLLAAVGQSFAALIVAGGALGAQMELGSGVLQARGRPVLAAAVASALWAPVAALALTMRPDIDPASLFVVALMVPSAVGLALVRSLGRTPGTPLLIRIADLTDGMRYGSVAVLSGVVSAAPLAVLAVSLPAAAVADLGTAQRVAAIAPLILAAQQPIYVPRIAQAAAARAVEALRRAYRASQRAALIALLPFSAAALLGAGPLGALLNVDAGVLRVLAATLLLGQLVNAGTGKAAQVNTITGHARLEVGALTLGTVVAVALASTAADAQSGAWALTAGMIARTAASGLGANHAIRKVGTTRDEA